MPELSHTKAVQLAPGLRRITAPNPGVMTGAGTNTYLLGQREVAVLDPGPDMPEHVHAILAAIEEGGGELARVFATHTHVDHSPATASLLRHRKVEVIGALATDNMFQDAHFAPDIQCQHDQVFASDEYSLRAVATPGHVSNHFCFLEQGSGYLMTGDHIMNGSTVVIVPPSGDMAAYIGSLRLLLDYPMSYLAPGHGDIMDNPAGVVKWLVEHRLERERKVLEVLRQHGQGSVDDLVLGVYDDVPVDIHPVAKLSLLAHLIKLEQEQRARRDDQHWVFISEQ
jgi:glyoxylase-like metal-dependent hydrolase (beta-lactamase superfamily II)